MFSYCDIVKRNYSDSRTDLQFCKIELLLKIARDSFELEAVRAHCVAEILIRRFLNPHLVPPDVVDSILIHGEREKLDRIFRGDLFTNCCKADLPEKLWDEPESFSQACERMTRKRFNELFQTDGLIPVFSENGAYFIPFKLRETGAALEIFDSEGKRIDGWSVHCHTNYHRLLSGHFTICCRQEELPLTLTGNSFMLPLLLAAHRKKGDLNYNPLAVIFTGAIGDDGHLLPVKIREKVSGAKECFTEFLMFYPECEGPTSENIVQLPLYDLFSDKTVLLEKIQNRIEEHGLMHLSFQEACHRISKLDREIASAQNDHWEKLQRRLIHIQENLVPPERNPQAYLLCLMRRSVTYCHNGDTENAMKYNELARDFAMEYGLEEELLKSEIEELVILLDQEDFGYIITRSAALQKQLKRFPENHDLLMRYCGTMAQANAYGFLAGAGNTVFSKAKALEYFKCACQHAYQLQIDRETNIAQDLNYLHLWYAIFEPGSEKEKDAYETALTHIRQNLSGQAKKTNAAYLLRQKAFACYRYALLHGSLPDFPLERLEPEDDMIPYLRMLTAKYLVCLYNLAGNLQAAKRAAEIVVAFQTEKHPIFDMISASGLLEISMLPGYETWWQSAMTRLKNTKYPLAEKWFMMLEKCSPEEQKNTLKRCALEYWY